MSNYYSRQLTRQIRKLERDRDRLIQPEVSPDLTSPFLALPMLRGFWAGHVNATGDWYDATDPGMTLTLNGNPLFTQVNIAPHWAYDGTGDFHTRADEAALDITGLEIYVAAASQGLTMGGWFRFDQLTRGESLMGKWTVAGNQRGYLLYKTAGDSLQFFVSVDGVAAVPATSTVAPTIGWQFLAGRFIPNTSVDIFVNGVLTVNAVAVASIFNNIQDFQIGASDGGVSNLDGGASLCFLCAAQCSDAIISNLFQQSRGAFGV